MSEMIERVARLFDPKAWALQPKTPLDEKAIEHWKHVARLKARAAIEAMREPTKEMTKLFDEADRLWCGDYPVNSTIAEMAWEMMIDAALKEKDPTP